MKAEQAKKLAEAGIARLAAALEQGKSQTLTDYLNTMGRFHRYSCCNVMLIALQRPNATHVAGYHTWRKLDRQVKKGEKGIGIIAPIIIRKKGQDESDTQDTILRFRGVTVFDISQTDGEPLPEFAQVSGDPTGHIDRLKAYVHGQGIRLEYVDDMKADGVSVGGTIRLRAGLSPAEEFSVLAHELAHEMLHKDRKKLPPKTVRETEAEAVAYVVSRAIGLDVGTASADYIQLYAGTPSTLADSLDQIQQTSAMILDATLLKGRGTHNERSSQPVSVSLLLKGSHNATHPNHQS